MEARTRERKQVAMQVLIVEDDVRLAQALAHILAENGYQTDVVHDGASGLAYAECGDYDVIILDVMLPKMDGFAVVAQLRRKSISVPVLLLTARDAVPDKITGLDSGADDYMTKPFAPAELLAHLRALTRRQGEVLFEKLAAGDLVLNLESYDLACGSKSIHLSYKEFSLAKVLMANAGQVVSKDMLIAKVWGRGVERRRQQRGGLRVVSAQEDEVPGIDGAHRDAAARGLPVRGRCRARRRLGKRGPSMLKKLRVKFIALNMATVAVVLAVVFTAICVIDYQQSVARVHETLDAALAHAGDAGGGPSSGTQPGAQVPADAARANGMPPEIGGKRGGSDPAIPVAVFSVEADGSLAAVQTRTTASIADDVLAQAAAALADQPDGSGSLVGLGLFYEKRTVGGAAYLAFADMSAASGWQTLAVTLAGVGAAALAAFFVISMFFSRWALAPVDRAWRQQRRFVADASHDLKTPLTVILANTSILLEHPERSIASQSQWIESTQHEAQQMQGLVGDLLLLAQVDEGAAPPPMERLDLTDLVEGELLQFESVAFERAVDLQSQLDESVMVRGNAMRLRKLVGTLLDNACKYADDGGSVNVSLRQSVRRIELAVHNTGFAIAPEDLPHVFDRFYRADKARTRDDSGYGLGLAIAHAIAEEHGGNLAAASDDERGTTFTLTLPTLPA